MTNKQIYYPSFSKRIGAIALDLSIPALILLIFIFMVPSTYKFLYSIFLCIYLIIIPVFTKGQSIGKRLFQIKAVTYPEYIDASKGQIFYREISKYSLLVLGFIDLLAPNNKILNIISNTSVILFFIYLIITFFIVMEGKNKRTLHDKLTNTIIIDLEEK